MKRTRRSRYLTQFQQNGCDQKVQYASPQLAYSSAKEAQRIQRVLYRHYHCWYCGYWHIAHVRDYD